ncbi:hypothetical protein DYD83_15085 [Dickeya fangzhongdai]|uniref:Uncharacterized protein n=1 Tax=Dickeya fangzhongdai TaxID=1778540 RepID=A0A2K8QNW5_9GAMM|nr:hypothetical protein CVE23_15020 [Dickeya fangzhongdai]AYH48876.1 hypothetical protein B6N31_14965 [Dickeya fangzhongdai]QOH48617.1 hypothetical protein DYD82_15085 [Dickeya fangzhongdai]QOH52921.1 hypothetical protein DYD83_15085 [Dickeya fangzhongdai]
MFSFSSTNVAKMIQKLDPVNKCHDYV